MDEKEDISMESLTISDKKKGSPSKKVKTNSGKPVAAELIISRAPTEEEVLHPDRKKEELVAYCTFLKIKKTGKKQELIQRIMSKLSGKDEEQEEVPTIAPPPVEKKSRKKVKTTPHRQPTVLENIRKSVPPIEILYNAEIKQFVHQETNLVFNNNKYVCGRYVEMENEIIPLTEMDIELCKKFKFPYEVPENLNQKGSGNDDAIPMDGNDSELDLSEEEEIDELDEEEEDLLEEDDDGVDDL